MEYNTHPALSSLPAAFLVAVLFCELLLLRRHSTALRVLALGNLWFAAVAYLAAFFSGYHGLEFANQTFTVSPDLIDTHHTIGRAGLFMVWPLLGIRIVEARATDHQRPLRAVYLVLLVLTVAVTLYASFLGGELVFSHGAGVRAPLPQ